MSRTGPHLAEMLPKQILENIKTYSEMRGTKMLKRFSIFNTIQKASRYTIHFIPYTVPKTTSTTYIYRSCREIQVIWGIAAQPYSLCNTRHDPSTRLALFLEENLHVFLILHNFLNFTNLLHLNPELFVKFRIRIVFIYDILENVMKQNWAK